MKEQKKLKVLLIGFGSIAKKHILALSCLKEYSFSLEIISKSLHASFLHSKNSLDVFLKKELGDLANIHFSELKKELKDSILDQDYFIIANETHLHFKTLSYLNKRLKNKTILVEKPLFHEHLGFYPLENKIFVAYQLRFAPIIQALKRLVAKKRVFYASFECHSFLPAWRSTSYVTSYSADPLRGGGVALDLSHELDLCFYLLGRMQLLNTTLKRLSSLKIKSEDLAKFDFKKGSSLAQITLDYFSHFEERKIKLFCDDCTLEADLLKGVLKYHKKHTKELFFTQDNIQNIASLHLACLRGLGPCSFDEGCFIMEQISLAKALKGDK